MSRPFTLLSVAALRMAPMASMRPTVFSVLKLSFKSLAVRSPLMWARSTVRKVSFFMKTVSSSLMLLPSEMTMTIIEINVSSPPTTDTITTPSAEASMVIPKDRGFFSISIKIRVGSVKWVVGSIRLRVLPTVHYPLPTRIV